MTIPNSTQEFENDLDGLPTIIQNSDENTKTVSRDYLLFRATGMGPTVASRMAQAVAMDRLNDRAEGIVMALSGIYDTVGDLPLRRIFSDPAFLPSLVRRFTRVMSNLDEADQTEANTDAAQKLDRIVGGSK